MPNNSEEYNQKIREIVARLSLEEQNLLKKALNIEAQYRRQAMHDNLDKTIVQEIQNAIEGDIR